MSQSEVPVLCDNWTGWNDVDFYLLKLRLDHIERIGFLYYLFHPKQALRDFKLWIRFIRFIKEVKKERAKTYFTNTPTRYKIKRPSIISRIKSWFKKPKTETSNEFVERRIEERLGENKEQLDEALAELTRALEKHKPDEGKLVDEKNKKE